jgi:hypothetical protein
MATEKPDDGYDKDDHEACADAETLQRAEEIKQDHKRHTKAVAHLAHKRDAIISAHANARRSLMQKTGKKMKSVFGEHGPADATKEESET